MVVRSGLVFKTDRLSYLYLFLHLTLKKCHLYIELNHILVVAGSDDEHNADTWDAADYVLPKYVPATVENLLHRIET